LGVKLQSWGRILEYKTNVDLLFYIQKLHQTLNLYFYKIFYLFVPKNKRSSAPQR
jgi:hypothetical protein